VNNPYTSISSRQSSIKQINQISSQKDIEKVPMITIHLSPFSVFLADGIDRLNEMIERERFTFVVNGNECFVSIVEAILLSPKVFELIQSDPTTNQFEICDEKIETDFFSDFICLIRGEIMKLTSRSRKSMLLFCNHIGNEPLAEFFFSLRITDSKAEIVMNLTEIESSNVFDLTLSEIEDFSLIDCETLEEILSNPELRIKSEDWLLRTILKFDSRYFGLAFSKTFFAQFANINSSNQESRSIFLA
jgi:hypothetical protein